MSWGLHGIVYSLVLFWLDFSIQPMASSAELSLEEGRNVGRNRTFDLFPNSVFNTGAKSDPHFTFGYFNIHSRCLSATEILS